MKRVAHRSHATPARTATWLLLLDGTMMVPRPAIRGVATASTLIALLFVPGVGQNVDVHAREFIHADSAIPSAHASTIVETRDHVLLAAWFGGSAEGQDDVEIWVSRKEQGKDWSLPRAVTSTPNMPVWNPVLFVEADTTWLFFKVGPSPREWVGAWRRSIDSGRTWSAASYLPAGLIGPVRTKPLDLGGGVWLAGSSVEAGYRWDSPADAPYRAWAVWVERTEDHGRTWSRYGPVAVPGEPFGVIQPTLWQSGGAEIRMLMRSTNRIGRIVASSSGDGGRSWSPAVPTNLPNPNAGIDVVRLNDGRLILVYNHMTEGRNALHLAVSDDDGITWGQPRLLEDGPGEYSYPAVIQSADGLVHVTYTWRRTRIRHVVIDPARIGRS
jgi:predicted neuraminidase